MKVYISCDLEGITGIIKEEQLSPPGRDYDRARRLMTREVNAAARGAFNKGADKVLVNDAHGEMDNIVIEELESGVELISGEIKPFSMMEGIWDGFDLAFFIGYHSMKGKKGVISHTYSGSVIKNVKINNRDVGETGINATMAGYFGVPIGLVSGDDVLVGEAKELLGESSEYVISKWALSKYSSWNKPLDEVCEYLEEKGGKAVENVKNLTPLSSPVPVKLELEFTELVYSQQALLLPGAKPPEKSQGFFNSWNDVSSPVISYEARDIVEAYRAFRTMIILANSVK